MEGNRITYTFDYKDIHIDKGRVERLMGFESGKVDEVFSTVIEQVNEEIGNRVKLKAELRFFNDFKITKETSGLQIRNEEFLPGKIILKQLKGAESLALVLCSAGEGVSKYITEAFNEGDSFKSYAIDLFGSEIAEAAMDMVQDDLKFRMAKEGLKISNRVSPGYCDWNLSEQHQFFKLFPNNYPCITLSDSALMNPIKSVSCLIGIGEKISFNNNSCSICGMKDCKFREKKQN